VKRKFAEPNGTNATRSPGMFLVEVSDKLWGVNVVLIGLGIFLIAIALP
jgi:hypothetical protein